MKFFLLLIAVVFMLQCSSETTDKRKTNWLASVNNTVWVSGSDKIVFSPSGERISNGSTPYVYVCSETSDSGLYQTDIMFPPTRWYLYKKSVQLYQYGPFLYRNDINTNDSSLTTVFIEQ